MPWLLAILITLLLFAGSIAVYVVTGFNVMAFVVIGTALWVAYDSRALDLRRYKSGLAYGPIILFFAVILLWIVVFPWYLIVRYRITSGRAELKGPPVAAS